MINVTCSCGANFKVQDELAGRHGKCPNCQKNIQVPNSSQRTSSQGEALKKNAATGDRSAKSRCRQCGAPAESLTYSCPFCGGSVQDVSSNSVEQSLQASNATRIDSMASVAGTLMNALDGGIGNLRREAAQVPDSPGELVTFFSKHIGGVSELHYGPIHRQACEAALTKLRVFSARDPKLANVVAELSRQLAEKPKAMNPLMLAGLLGFLGFLGLLLMLGLSVFMLRQEGTTRSEINQLIDQKKFSEARMRAEEISNKNQRESILKTIDKAQDQTD